VEALPESASQVLIPIDKDLDTGSSDAADARSEGLAQNRLL
jgi:hypothetical protein